MRYSLVVLIILFLGGSVAAQIPPSDNVLPVVVALQPIPRGTLITDSVISGEAPLFAEVLYPAAAVPATVYQSVDLLVGQRLRTDVNPEQPIARHYLYPDPLYAPDAEIPFAISPTGYVVTRDYGVYRVVELPREQLTFPSLLAAGDVVDLLETTQTGNILQDETRPVIESVVVAEVTDETIRFSVAFERAEILESAVLPITIVLRSSASQETSFEIPLISWAYLLERDFDPIVVPSGADLSQLGR